MISKHHSHLVPYAKELRKNMTKEEKHLWYDFLRTYKVKFLRQKILGKYIADFYCAEAKLVIELDGSEHYTPEAKRYDEERTAFLSGYDIIVVRILNQEVNRNFYGVCEYINKIVSERISTSP
jgi:very-short-patch-repair endonuclease